MSIKSIRNLDKFILSVIIIAFSIVIYFFVDKNTSLNYLQIGIMSLSPIILFLNYKKTHKDELLFYAIMILMFLSVIFNSKNLRWSTLIYSYMFIITYIVYLKVLSKGNLEIDFYLSLIKLIIYLYALVLMIQQISVLSHIPVFNQCWEFSENKMKLNSLSMEPSNTALILPLLMFSYIRIIEVINKKKYLLIDGIKNDKLVWIAFLYTILTCGSMTAFFSLPVFFFYFLNKKGIRNILIMIPIMVILLVIIFKNNELAYTRFLELWSTLFTLDPNTITEQDASASVRITPYIIFFRNINIFDIHTWLGHGIDSSEMLYNSVITDDVSRDVGAMNITNLFYDYGFIAGIVFIIALKRATTSKYLSYEMLFYTLLFSVITINHYVLWLYVILMSTNYYYKRKFKYLYV